MLDDLIDTPGVTEDVGLLGPIGVMALHGGLEAQTAEVVGEVSLRSGASRYLIVQPDDLAWHVPSTAYDPRLSQALASFVTHVSMAVSVHGFGRKGYEDAVLLGGSNRPAARRLATRLRAHTDLAVVDDLDAMPPGLTGTHPANPVNLPHLGGVQVELSPGARAHRHVGGVVRAIVAFINSETASVCSR